MFTGIVQETGSVQIQEQGRAGTTLKVRCPKLGRKLKIGDSLSIDGVCLTVSEKRGGFVFLEATPETLRLTNLGSRKAGDLVNLEAAARLSDFLGGHLVQGHVDGTGKVLSIIREGNSRIVRFSAPRRVLKYCAVKGSIAVNGVSLTINRVDRQGFEVAIIPHTLEMTNFGVLEEGDDVNLEADVMSKYVEAHVRRCLSSGRKRLAGIFLGWLVLGGGALSAGGLELAANSILIYENQPSRGRATEFVVRLARYKPDILLEWESSSDQGTIQLYQEAVEKADTFSLSGLFEMGVDIESSDTMTIWLSRRLYQELAEKGKANVKINRLATQMQVKNEGTVSILVNGEELEIPVIYVDDGRSGIWVFQKDPENPILVQFASPYFLQSLKRVSTAPTNKLRWIQKPAPVR